MTFICVSVSQTEWKPSLSSSGQNSARRTLSSGWPVKITSLWTQIPNYSPKPSIFIPSSSRQRPLKRYGQHIFTRHLLCHTYQNTLALQSNSKHLTIHLVHAFLAGVASVGIKPPPPAVGECHALAGESERFMMSRTGPLPWGIVISAWSILVHELE